MGDAQASRRHRRRRCRCRDIRVVVGSPFLAQDRVDQIGLAQTPEALKSDLVGNQVQIGERACLQLGAVEHCHMNLLLGSSVRAVGVRSRWTATGTRM